MDIAKRCEQNPLLAPKDLKAGINGMEKYSLAYYNKSKRQWETLPTDPVVNDILWIFPPEHPSHQQTIKLYTSESPNHPGKYRIYKSFNRGTKVAYGEFELLP